MSAGRVGRGGCYLVVDVGGGAYIEFFEKISFQFFEEQTLRFHHFQSKSELLSTQSTHTANKTPFLTTPITTSYHMQL